ncbi:uncharacterized protein ANIA_11318 [Aspergillus nidulans FGSC A4]|uniref:Uncharacterized protein n=1 Tax=Emericella nidulans (strain FGSC A4 / ATCC 38163 / CBS 112.46 / NRRL 194 / M139) TaxID=227321 RepID=C8VKI8_EMENI|nr:hypothetical protein [Aspergillus nidulans FGSC A4]CBF85761.1 TPA: hypothetical protein ANIA_11318 [Aspergillus nidulans FGSC A4]
MPPRSLRFRGVSIPINDAPQVYAAAEKKDGGFIRNLKLDEGLGSSDLVAGLKVLSISGGESFKGGLSCWEVELDQ